MGTAPFSPPQEINNLSLLEKRKGKVLSHTVKGRATKIKTAAKIKPELHTVTMDLGNTSKPSSKNTTMLAKVEIPEIK